MVLIERSFLIREVPDSVLAMRLKMARRAETEASTAPCTFCQLYSRSMKSSMMVSSFSTANSMAQLETAVARLREVLA